MTTGSATPLVDPRAREVLRRLEIDVARRLDGLLQGDHRGLVPGLGSEPGEAREYVAGDDIRRMDWNVTARTGTPHVRDTVADRELETTVLVDASASLAVGTRVRTKYDLAVAVTAAAGLLTNRSGNRFGAVVVSGDGLHVHRARSGRRHLLAVLHRLVTRPPVPGRAGLAEGLARLASPVHRAGLTVVVSDLLTDDWADPLRAVTRRHETLVVEIVDPLELELPDVGPLTVIDAETGEHRRVRTSRRARERFAQAARRRLAAHRDACRRAGADHLVLRTDDDWVVRLAHFVDRRRRGRPARARLGVR